MTEDNAPYLPFQVRLKSVTWKTVKVRREPATRVTVKWEKQLPDGTWDAFAYASVRDPGADLWTSLEALLPHVIALMELPPDYSRNCRVVGVKVAYDDEGNQIATTTVTKLTAAGECNIETPALPASGPYDILQEPGYHIALMAVESEALLFRSM